MHMEHYGSTNLKEIRDNSSYNLILEDITTLQSHLSIMQSSAQVKMDASDSLIMAIENNSITESSQLMEKLLASIGSRFQKRIMEEKSWLDFLMVSFVSLD